MTGLNLYVRRGGPAQLWLIIQDIRGTRSAHTAWQVTQEISSGAVSENTGGLLQAGAITERVLLRLFFPERSPIADADLFCPGELPM